jgi:hypothetical protein
MQQQRTVFSRQNKSDDQEDDRVTVAAFGAQHRAEPGKSVGETLEDLGLAPQPYQSIRVGGVEVKELERRKLKSGEIVTVTNRVVGGG